METHVYTMKLWTCRRKDTSVHARTRAHTHYWRWFFYCLDLQILTAPFGYSCRKIILTPWAASW